MAPDKVDTSRFDPTVNLAADNFDNPRGSAEANDGYLEVLQGTFQYSPDTSTPCFAL